MSGSRAVREPALAGKTVVVIGGSAGIGFATARHAHLEGAEVIVTGRSPERLERAAKELGATSFSAFDATDPPRLARFFATWTADSTWSPADQPSKRGTS